MSTVISETTMNAYYALSAAIRNAISVGDFEEAKRLGEQLNTITNK